MWRNGNKQPKARQRHAKKQHQWRSRPASKWQRNGIENINGKKAK
jgi:hypothetical protein